MEKRQSESEAPPDMARLAFAVPLHNNSGHETLETLQQVYISERSLNLLVLRFHPDRSQEFFNKKKHAWFHERGVRTTTAATTEGNTPQQNSAAEGTVRWLWARAVTLLTSAKSIHVPVAMCHHASRSTAKGTAVGPEVEACHPLLVESAL